MGFFTRTRDILKLAKAANRIYPEIIKVRQSYENDRLGTLDLVHKKQVIILALLVRRRFIEPWHISKLPGNQMIATNFMGKSSIVITLQGLMELLKSFDFSDFSFEDELDGIFSKGDSFYKNYQAYEEELTDKDLEIGYKLFER